MLGKVSCETGVDRRKCIKLRPTTLTQPARSGRDDPEKQGLVRLQHHAEETFKRSELALSVGERQREGEGSAVA